MAAESEEIRSRGQRLDGWKAIADYADRSERAVQRWSTQRGFPVHRIGGSGSVFAWTGEIDDWFNRQGANPNSDPEAPASSSTPSAAPGPLAAPASGPASVPPSGPDAASAPAGTHSPDQPALAPAPPSPVVIARMPWPHMLFVMVCAAVLGNIMTLSVLGPTGLVGLGVAPASVWVSDEPCHVVAWPSEPLPARGGRVRVAVRPATTPCDWTPPKVDARWLLVVPPSALSVPDRILLSPNHPLAMPPYDPNADHLTIEVAANHTTKPRVAVVRTGSREVRLTQAPAPTACLVPPGPGFVTEGWRFLLSRQVYSRETPFLEALRRDESPEATGVSWGMLKMLLLGDDVRGEAFAAQVGMARASWEESEATANCFHVWLSGDGPPHFVTYFQSRRRISYEERDQINNDQYQLGTFPIPSQVLYRVPAAAAAPSPPASGASRP